MITRFKAYVNSSQTITTISLVAFATVLTIDKLYVAASGLIFLQNIPLQTNNYPLA